VTDRVAARLALVLVLAACGGSHDALSDSCVQHVNSLRASIGLGPLSRWSGAEPCADAEAESDSGTGKPHGAFGRCQESAQNECPGWSSMTGPGGIVPGCLDLMWAEGPTGGHYANMTRSGYTQVACGFHQTSSGGIWAVQDFR
jgi:Cysteine-rich secretory protein family